MPSFAGRVHPCSAIGQLALCVHKQPTKRPVSKHPSLLFLIWISRLKNARKQEGASVTFGSFALFSPLIFSKLFLLIFFFFFSCSLPSHHLTSPLPPPPLPTLQPLGREANPREGEPEPAPTCCKFIAAPPRCGFPSFAGNKYELLAPRLNPLIAFCHLDAFWLQCERVVWDKTSRMTSANPLKQAN